MRRGPENKVRPAAGIRQRPGRREGGQPRDVLDVDPVAPREATVAVVSALVVENAALAEENTTLKQRIRELEGLDGEKCPKCRRMGWRIVDSKPDPTFGDLGGTRRTYKCSECGLSESKLVQ